MRMILHRLAQSLRPARHRAARADPAALRDFLATRAAFVAQKTVLDYCAVKLALNWDKARREAMFAEALAACRWAVFYPAAGDLTLAAARWLLPHAPPARLAERMAALGEAALRQAATGGDPAAIEEGAQALRQRLLSMPGEPAASPARMILRAAQPLLETLPIHPDLRKNERPAILGGLRMNFLSAFQDMERAFDAAPLAARIVAD